MNISLQQKIYFSLASGLIFAIINELTNIWLLDREFSWGLFAFNLFFFGSVFGLGFLYFMKRSTVKMMLKIQVKLEDHESIKFEGPANLFKGIESVGGKLTLTDQRLIFKSHKFNIQSGQTDFLLEDIQIISPRKTIGLLKNGIRITDKQANHFDLIVYSREKWLQHLDALIGRSA